MSNNITAELAFCLRSLIDLTPEALAASGLKEAYDRGELSRHFDALKAYDETIACSRDVSVHLMRGAQVIHATILHARGESCLPVESFKTAREDILTAAEEQRADAHRRLRRAALYEAAAKSLETN